ncbi:hypothetical protein I317_01389 [Kwoniella heveanensis CBS 569]|nr:hypothetical protein I317_01389 [Kwoniella heveanensis CBS 569]
MSETVSNINSEVEFYFRHERGDDGEDLIVFEKDEPWSVGDVEEAEAALYDHVESYTYWDEYTTE